MPPRRPILGKIASFIQRLPEVEEVEYGGQDEIIFYDEKDQRYLLKLERIN